MRSACSSWAATRPGRAHLPGASAQAIDFSPGQLRLRGLSPSPEALQALQEQLSTAGYLANMDNDTLVVQARNGL